MLPVELTGDIIRQIIVAMPEVINSGLKGKALRERLAVRTTYPLEVIESFLSCEVNYLINNLQRKAPT